MYLHLVDSGVGIDLGVAVSFVCYAFDLIVTSCCCGSLADCVGLSNVVRAFGFMLGMVVCAMLNARMLNTSGSNAADQEHMVVFQNLTMVHRFELSSLTPVLEFEQLCDIFIGFVISLCVDVSRDADIYYVSMKLFCVSPYKLPLRE